MADYTDDFMDEQPAQSQAVTVAGKRAPVSPQPYRGMSPLMAGLLYGGAATTVMGPLGLLMGVGAGIAAKRMRDSELDHQTRFLNNMAGEQAGLQDQLDQEKRIADPDEARMLDHAKRIADDGWRRLAAGDQTGRDMIAQANEISRGIMQGDKQNRDADANANASFQRGLIGTAANDYRAQYQQNMAVFNSIQEQTDKVLAMANDPSFDPDKPFSKAVLADMLQTGVGGMYRDAPGMLDAVAQGAPMLGALLGGPAGAIAGTGVTALTTALKSADFKVGREEYNRVALNMRAFAQKYATQKMSQLGAQADNLDKYARQSGALSGDNTLHNYISGGVDKLELTPVPKLMKDADSSGFNKGPQANTPVPGQPGRVYPPSEQYVAPVNRFLRGMKSWIDNKYPNAGQRPTN